MAVELRFYSLYIRVLAGYFPDCEFMERIKQRVGRDGNVLFKAAALAAIDSTLQAELDIASKSPEVADKAAEICQQAAGVLREKGLEVLAVSPPAITVKYCDGFIFKLFDANSIIQAKYDMMLHWKN